MEVRRRGGVYVETAELRCRFILEVKLNLKFKLGTGRARVSKRHLEVNDHLAEAGHEGDPADNGGKSAEFGRRGGMEVPRRRQHEM